MSDETIKDLMIGLHKKLAERFEAILDGEEPTASELNTIRQFLRDNGIDCNAEANPGMQRVESKFLPFADAIRDVADGVTLEEEKEVS
jgi:hypothetical protein